MCVKTVWSGAHTQSLGIGHGWLSEKVQDSQSHTLKRVESSTETVSSWSSTNPTHARNVDPLIARISHSMHVFFLIRLMVGLKNVTMGTHLGAIIVSSNDRGRSSVRLATVTGRRGG